MNIRNDKSLWLYHFQVQIIILYLRLLQVPPSSPLYFLQVAVCTLDSDFQHIVKTESLKVKLYLFCPSFWFLCESNPSKNESVFRNFGSRDVLYSFCRPDSWWSYTRTCACMWLHVQCMCTFFVHACACFCLCLCSAVHAITWKRIISWMKTTSDGKRIRSRSRSRSRAT